MEKQIIGKYFDEERALYAERDAELIGCVFEGEADGESALKECEHIKATNCRFALRYPLWHGRDFLLCDSNFTVTCRAPMWYTRSATLRHCIIDGVKALRECDDTLIENTVIRSPEFGWRCRDVKLRGGSVESEYLLFEAKDIEIKNTRIKGKYSFQYVENASITDSLLDTKDAFWHSKNVTVTDCEIRGEYLGWYSEGLTLINCHISGTQPFCYCKGLRLISCTTEGCDLAFEYSEVDADIWGDILSVKNPKSGRICADNVGEVILEDSVMENNCEIVIKGAKK